MKQLFGGLLLAVGILLMTGSGLCSVTVIVLGGREALKDPGLLFLPAIFGGIPFGVGFLVFKLGQRIVRRANAELENGDDIFR